MAVSLSGEGKVCQVKGHTCPNTNEKGGGQIKDGVKPKNSLTHTLSLSLSLSLTLTKEDYGYDRAFLLSCKIRHFLTLRKQ